MDDYTTCGQCMKNCPVEALQCDIGKKHYQEVTGKEYASSKKASEDDGAAYRRMIRERRARKQQGLA